MLSVKKSEISGFTYWLVIFLLYFLFVDDGNVSFFFFSFELEFFNGSKVGGSVYTVLHAYVSIHIPVTGIFFPKIKRASCQTLNNY